MTIDELRALIEDLDGETEVRVAFQPSYPLEYALDEDNCAERDGVFWLAEKFQIGYLTEGIATELGWSY